MKEVVTFGQVSGGRENNFDFLRFFFAAMVIFAHSYAFLYTGLMQNDPLVRFSNGQVGLGDLAVNSFFLISGFLITRSWIYSNGLKSFAIKRALRLMPALVAALLFCMFVVGPLATTLPLGTYLRSADTYRYFGFMLHSSLHVYDKLPGVFVHNSYALRVNGSLWTIRQEIVCYAFVALAGLAGAYRRPALLLAFVAVPYLLDVRGAGVVGTGGIHDFFHLLTYFMAGMLVYLYRDRIVYARGLMLLSLALIVVSGIMGHLPLVLPVCSAYLLFYIAFNTGIPLQHFARHGDLSYGIYLYAFPIQQLLAAYFRNSLNALSLSLCALAICAALAAVSWRFVEQPFLKLKARPRTSDAETFAAAQERAINSQTAT